MSDQSIKRCPKCGNEYPLTPEYFQPIKRGSSRFHTECRSCRAERARQWRIANPDKKREYERTSTRHKQAKRTADRRYGQTHRPTINARVKRWKQAHPDRIEHRDTSRRREAQRRCRAKYPERYRARVQRSRKAKPALYRGFKHVRRARERNTLATFTPQDWQFALDYFGGCCAVCGRPVGLWHTLAQDHWIPVAKGGAYTPDNVVPLCHGLDGCNNSKNDTDPVVWLNSRYTEQKARETNARIEAYFVVVRARAHDHD